MRRCLLIGTVLASLATGRAAALDPLAAPDDDPPSSFTGYWLALGWKEHPPQGAQKAKGIVFWSHGVNGSLPQYQFAPNDAVRRFARAGWDVVKIQRNPTFENGGWTAAGLKHVADLVRRAEAARAEGYARVVAAGQSYGGIISIEASGRTAAIDTVLAFAPGHGSDAINGSHARRYDNLTGMLVDAIGAMKAGRASVLVAGGDVLHPNELRGPKVGAALAGLGVPYALFDERMPVKGHGAGATRQFDVWYGDCVLRFVEAAAPPMGETLCPTPAQTRFLLPDDAKPVALPAGLPPDVAGLVGAWRGTPDPADGREWLVLINDAKPDAVRWWLATDAGPQQARSMNGGWWNGRRSEDRFRARSTTGAHYEIALAPGGEALDLAYVDPQGQRRWTSRFTRTTQD